MALAEPISSSFYIIFHKTKDSLLVRLFNLRATVRMDLFVYLIKVCFSQTTILTWKILVGFDVRTITRLADHTKIYFPIGDILQDMLWSKLANSIFQLVLDCKIH